MTSRLWVEGRFPSTNAALDMRGRDALYLRASHGRELAGGFAAFARLARAATKVAARRACVPAVPPGALACVWIYLAGHTGYDPDGWALAGKWILDGLTDAGVLASDRRNVYAVGGRVFGTAEEADGFIGAVDGWTWCRRPGAFVELATGRP